MNQRSWVSVSLLNLSIVAFLGFILRSKILFSLPFIDYNYLLNTHSHLAFGGWVTLALMVLIIYELLPEQDSKKTIYQLLLIGITISSYGMLFSFPFQGYGTFSIFFSTIFILVTYIFGWVFIKDVRKSHVSKTVLLLAIAAMIAMMLSSIGPFTLSYLLASGSHNALLLRESVYSYLHLQYNGFFALSIFALLFHKLERHSTGKAKQNIHRFALFLVISIVPSLFLSFLSQDKNNVLFAIAIAGSILVFISCFYYIRSLLSIKERYHQAAPIIRITGALSMLSFLLKLILQMLTIFTPIGNKVFGDRPIIIAYLHLVFLGFVTLFILAYFTQKGFLNRNGKFSQFALILFITAVILNEGVLTIQGLGVMFMISFSYFSWLLWGISILLFTGAVLLLSSQLSDSSIPKKP